MKSFLKFYKKNYIRNFIISKYCLVSSIKKIPKILKISFGIRVLNSYRISKLISFILISFFMSYVSTFSKINKEVFLWSKHSFQELYVVFYSMSKSSLQFFYLISRFVYIFIPTLDSVNFNTYSRVNSTVSIHLNTHPLLMELRYLFDMDYNLLQSVMDSAFVFRLKFFYMNFYTGLFFVKSLQIPLN
jgi:hypothetical protein